MEMIVEFCKEGYRGYIQDETCNMRNYDLQEKLTIGSR